MIPHNETAELATLSCFALDPLRSGSLIVERGIDTRHFHIPAHVVTFTTMRELWQASKTIDSVTLPDRLRSRGQFDEVGGWAFLERMFDCAPGVSALPEYLDDLTAACALRQMALFCSRWSRLLPDRISEEAAETLAEFTKECLAIGGAEVEPEKTFKELLFDKLDRLEFGLPDADLLQTGISNLDRHSPLHRGDLIVLSGERKAGKSILALTIALANLRKGHGVLYFSLEDTVQKLIDRAFAAISRVSMSKDHISKFSEPDLIRVKAVIGEAGNWKMLPRDRTHDLASIVASIRREKASMPELAIVILDYGQLARVPFQKGVNREHEVAEVSRSMRLLTLELGIAIILLSQLNEDGRTRESRQLEMDCTASWKIALDENETNVRLLTIPFQRNGESGIGFKVSFFGDTARVEAMAYDTDYRETAKKPSRAGRQAD